MFLQPKHLKKKKKKKNLLDAAVTDRGCWRENERLYGPTHQAYHRRSQTIQTVWIHPSSLTQTTKRGTGKSWMGRGHRVTGTLAVAFRQCFSHFSMKSRLLDVSGTNYAPSFTRWNTKLLTCLLTHSLKQSRPDAFHFHWSSSFSQTFPLRLSESNNDIHHSNVNFDSLKLARLHAVSNQFQVFNVMRVALLVQQGIVLI